MKIKDYKCKCGFDDFYFSSKGNQTGIYCIRCGKWLKWADKDERNLTLKRIDDIDDAPTIEIPKWIPVSEGLPNERENVLVYCQENQCIFTAILDRQAWHYFGGVGYDFIPWKVIAWMPLPEPYKGENNAK